MSEVPGHLPDDPLGRLSGLSWLRETLFERRVVVVAGRLTDATAARVAAEILMLDAIGDEAIDLYVDSADGSIEAAFVIIDVLDLVHSPVHGYARGLVGGAAIGVVAAAHHRYALPNATFRLAHASHQFTGTPDQIAEDSRRHCDLVPTLQARLAQATGRSIDAIADDMRRGRYLDARGAVEYGLVEAITSVRNA